MLAAPLEGGVEIGGLHDREAADVLLGSDERAVGRREASTFCLNDRRRGGGVQACREHPRPGSLHLLPHRPDVPHDGFQSSRRGSWPVGLVDAEQISRHSHHLSASIRMRLVWIDRLHLYGPPPSMSNAVEFRDVTLAFDDHVVLRNLSFTVPKGSMRILLGASGAGKSVCLKLTLGLLRPDSG